MQTNNLMFIFPGQGSQYPGMGRDLYDGFLTARSVYNRASEVLGYNMAELSFQDPDDKLTRTEYAQPALLTHSIACMDVFKDLTDGRFLPTTAAGHSLGEYSALVAAGSLTFESALKLVQKRGELMGEFGQGQMVAFSLDLDTVRSFVDSFYCGIGGCNLPDQTVVGGTPDDLARLVEHVRITHHKAGIHLKTEGAFHTYLMVNAANAFRPVLDSTPIDAPKISVLSNYSGHYHSSDPSTIRAHLFFQIFNPVKWIWGMQRALNDRKHTVHTVLELGGGIGAARDSAGKRPNLESITRRAIVGSSHSALYVSGINVHTLKRASHLFKALAGIRAEARDHPPNASGFGLVGNAVDENWFHLFVPTVNGNVTESAIELLVLVHELGLAEFVQLIGESRERNLEELKQLFGDEIRTAEPYLECVVGCETACLLTYRGSDAANELHRLMERLQAPGYHAGVMPTASTGSIER